MPNQHQQDGTPASETTEQSPEINFDNIVPAQDNELPEGELHDVETVEDLDINTLKQQLQEATAKVDENWNLYLSARAEANNIQKRAERDVGNAHKYALEKFIPELLSVKDSIELGTKAASENLAASEEENNEQLTTFIEGSEMAITMFDNALSKSGVVMIDPKDEIFNPELHQAMTMVPNPALQANTIIEVVQKGYMLNERLLRPAMVIVSKAD